eukprot:7391957-Prymnesium_polylepis.1
MLAPHDIVKQIVPWYNGTVHVMANRSTELAAALVAHRRNSRRPSREFTRESCRRHACVMSAIQTASDLGLPLELLSAVEYVRLECAHARGRSGRQLARVCGVADRINRATKRSAQCGFFVGCAKEQRGVLAVSGRIGPSGEPKVTVAKGRHTNSVEVFTTGSSVLIRTCDLQTPLFNSLRVVLLCSHCRTVLFGTVNELLNRVAFSEAVFCGECLHSTKIQLEYVPRILVRRQRVDTLYSILSRHLAGFPVLVVVTDDRISFIEAWHLPTMMLCNGLHSIRLQAAPVDTIIELFSDLRFVIDTKATCDGEDAQASLRSLSQLVEQEEEEEVVRATESDRPLVLAGSTGAASDGNVATPKSEKKKKKKKSKRGSVAPVVVCSLSADFDAVEDAANVEQPVPMNTDQVDVAVQTEWLTADTGTQTDPEATTFELSTQTDPERPNTAMLECPICMQDLDSTELSCMTPCGHVGCIVCWFEAAGVCPICRSPGTENRLFFS